ncbi:MAG: glycosyl hydrolase family 98 C-terminal domain-containing protein [bacterium]
MRLFKTEDFTNPEEVKRFFDSLYPPFYEGDAFLIRVGNLIVAMNSRENEDINQSFKLSVKTGNIKSIRGELAPHSYIVGREKDGRFLLLLNGREERQTKISFACSRKPSFEISPAQALLNSEWREGELTLTLSHKFGSAQIEIK